MSDMNEDEGQKLYPWQEGLPTKPDVDLLLKTWPEPKAGDRFEYESVEALLHVERGTARFKTVTTSWRKRMLELGFVVECETGAAFYVATVGDVLSRTHGALRFAGRKLHKQRRKLGVQKKATDMERTQIEHDARLLNANERELKKARMNLVLPTARPSEMPQIRPPEIAESS